MQCLKEGYIKAVGEGLRFGLHRLEFRVHSPIEVGTYALDTEIFVDGKQLSGWRAEETMLDANHIATVVMQQVSGL
jgi:phosphopantetheinyl transferase